MSEPIAKMNPERDALYHLLNGQLKEQRASRRWGLLFKLISFSVIGYFVIFPLFTMQKDMKQSLLSTEPHTALIDIYGEIDSSRETNADNVIESLENAFDNRFVKGVVLRINSPGGSPVQARQIYNAIQALKLKKPDIKVYAAIEDMGTSAAYLISAAAHGIYCDKTSLVGSIGVLLDSFGYIDVMQKVGVERRLYNAGAHKGILDPFSPRKPEEDSHIQAQLDMTHRTFIEDVKQGRGEKLVTSAPDLFTGLFWSGEQARNLGLVDGFGDVRSIAKNIIKAENIVDYTTSMGLLDKLTYKLGASIADRLAIKSGITLKGLQ